jgi:hypothetical protein
MNINIIVEIWDVIRYIFRHRQLSSKQRNTFDLFHSGPSH